MPSGAGGMPGGGGAGFPPGGMHFAGGMPGGGGSRTAGSRMDARRAEEIFEAFFGGQDPFADVMGGGGMGGGPSRGDGRSGVFYSVGGMPGSSGGGMGGMQGMGGFPPGMSIGGMGGMPGMGGMGGAGMKRGAPSPTRAEKRWDAMPPGTKATAFGLVNAAQHNGKTCKVLEYDPSKER